MSSLRDIDMGAAATLIVAWRTGHHASGAVVNSGGDVTDALREHAESARTAILSGRGHAYNPDDEQEDDVPFLTATQDELLDTALLDQLRLGSSLPAIDPGELKRRALTLYALLIGNDPAFRVIFVRKANPVSLATKSVVARLLDNTLTRVNEPIFAFDSAFDCVLWESDVWILQQKNFEALFKESEAVLASTSKWADELGQVLPISGDGKEWLAARLRQNSVTRRKVQSILRSPYVSKIDADALRTKMLAHGLNPGELMHDDALVFSKDTERDLLLLLNEDLWAGDFSGHQYAAARKARREAG
jgi:Domain of unknown function (DUF4868)